MENRVRSAVLCAGLLALFVFGCGQEASNQAGDPSAGALTVKLVNWTKPSVGVVRAFSHRLLSI